MTTHETIDPDTGEVLRSRRVYHRSELEVLYCVEHKRRLFRRVLSAEERRTADEAARELESRRDAAKERGRTEAKWVEEVLLSTDAVTRLACEEEIGLRKELAGADAKVHEARRREELRAAALGYRWDEVEVQVFADDADFAIVTVRMDTLEEVSRRRMSEYEAKLAEERKQRPLFGEH